MKNSVDIEESQYTPSKINSKGSTARDTTVKPSKAKTKRILKEAREKWHHIEGILSKIFKWLLIRNHGK